MERCLRQLSRESAWDHHNLIYFMSSLLPRDLAYDHCHQGPTHMNSVLEQQMGVSPLPISPKFGESTSHQSYLAPIVRPTSHSSIDLTKGEIKTSHSVYHIVVQQKNTVKLILPKGGAIAQPPLKYTTDHIPLYCVIYKVLYIFI